MAQSKSNVYAQQHGINEGQHACTKGRRRTNAQTGWVPWYAFAVELAPMSSAFLFRLSGSGFLSLAKDATGGVVC